MLGTEVESLLKQKKMHYIATDQDVDVTDIKKIRSFVKDKPIHWFLNCSGYTAVDKAEDEPELAFKINSEGPLNIAQIARAKRTRLIHISTDYVFDGSQKEPYTEDDRPNPLSVYGASKYKGELNIMRTLSEYFIIRTAWLYGQHGHNFVNTMLKLFKERDEVKVVADQWGSPTYAVDLAAAIIAMINSSDDKYGIYNFTNEGKTNWYGFAVSIFQFAIKYGGITNHCNVIPITTEQYPTKAKRPKNSSLSTEKIQAVFNVNVRNWKVALENYISC